VSALIAAGLGARVALVERERTGGDCLWTGCVPSKALLASAGLAHGMRTAAALGLPACEPAVDLAAVMRRVREAQAAIEPQDSPRRLRSAGVEVIEADAAFTGPRTLAVPGRELRFTRALVATGSRPLVPPVPGLEEAGPLTSETVWDLDELPARLLVLGGGPIGCELGQGFARLGAQVTLVEQGPRLLAHEEEAASELIEARLREEGVRVHTGIELTAVEAGEPARSGPSGAEGVATLDGAEEVRFDRVLVATGREPRTDGLGLERAGVAVDDRGAVVVDERLRTSNAAVYAAGDVVAGGLPFTLPEPHHARVATPNALLGLRQRVERRAIPWVTFTDPEVARVGLTAAQARERWGDRAAVVDSDYGELDRAVAAGSARGFARLVGDRRGRLVGATVAAPGGGEAIAELTAWLSQGAKIDAVSRTIHAHPTLAEGPARAADEHLRRRLLDARVKALVRPVLAIRRMVAR
jgi:pyruvate/2-oxoglutarate dehydrogenase complex dihydrolipoamide dehydrogenase (E3) component